MQESGVAFLRKYSEAARHSKSIKASYVVLWYCVTAIATITLAMLAGLFIIKGCLDIMERVNVNRTLL